MTRGKLIVIEGADGTGKQTQTALLEERLRTEGFAVSNPNARDLNALACR